VIWVIDASVAVRWFIEEEAHPNSDEVLRAVVQQPERFAVPELFTFEVFSVLVRLHPNGLQAFRKGILPILHAGIFRQPMTEDLAVKANRFVKLGLSGYDACYAALSKDLNGKWLTFDEKAHKIIRKKRVSILIKEKMPGSWPG
jgi:predicted nucleic acid-binding protein